MWYLIWNDRRKTDNNIPDLHYACCWSKWKKFYPQKETSRESSKYNFVNSHFKRWIHMCLHILLLKIRYDLRNMVIFCTKYTFNKALIKQNLAYCLQFYKIVVLFQTCITICIELPNFLYNMSFFRTLLGDMRND